MELEFTLEKADLLAYANSARKALLVIIKPRIRYLVVMWCVACVITFNLGLLIDQGKMLGIILVFLATIFSLLGYTKLYLKRYYNLYYSPEFFPDSFVPQKRFFNANNLVNVRQNSRAEFLWSGINEIVHAQAHTFILLPNKTGFIVPHRIFRNSTEVQGFKDQLGAFWNSGKTKTTTLLNASAK